MPFHGVIVIVEGSMTMPCFLLPQWNEIHAIPPYIDVSGRKLCQCHLVDYCLDGIGLVPFHHTLTQMEGNYGNAPFLNEVLQLLCVVVMMTIIDELQ